MINQNKENKHFYHGKRFSQALYFSVTLFTISSSLLISAHAQRLFVMYQDQMRPHLMSPLGLVRCGRPFHDLILQTAVPGNHRGT